MKRRRKVLPNELPTWFFTQAKKLRDDAKEQGLPDPPKKIWSMAMQAVGKSDGWKQYQRGEEYRKWHQDPKRTWNLISAEQRRSLEEDGKPLQYHEARTRVSQRKREEKEFLKKSRRNYAALLTYKQAKVVIPKLLRHIKANLTKENSYPISMQETSKGILIGTGLIDEEHIGSIIGLLRDVPRNTVVKFFSLFLAPKEIFSLFGKTPLSQKICPQIGLSNDKHFTGRCYHFLVTEHTKPALCIIETAIQDMPFRNSCGYGFDISLQTLFDIHDFNIARFNGFYPLSIKGVLTSQDENGTIIFENLSRDIPDIFNTRETNFYRFSHILKYLDQLGSQISILSLLRPAWGIIGGAKEKAVEKVKGQVRLLDSKQFDSKKEMSYPTSPENWSATKAFAGLGTGQVITQDWKPPESGAAHWEPEIPSKIPF